MEKEIWKDILGYEGQYQISNMGRVKSLGRKVWGGKTYYFKEGKILKNKIGKNKPYYYVCLYKNNKQKTFMIHTLVALNFIGERPYKNDICHINGDSSDNRLSNLRYDTRTENFNDMYRQGKKNPNGKLSIDEVLEIRRVHREEKLMHKEIAEMFNISLSTVNAIVTRYSYWYINDDGTIDESKTQIK